MFRLKLFILVLIAFSSHFAFAGNFGLGGILFSPTGASINYYFDKEHSIDGALATGLNDNDQNLYLHSTYLWHKPGMIKISRTSLDLFYGAGARIISWDEDHPKNNKKNDYKDETYIGPRGSIGAGYYFPEPRLQVFGELSLTIDVIPETEADIDVALGLRYYFK